ncbi:gamma carbonic anhydrase family protein [Gryllotalpicola protaetiae]|uniref:Gamma carbonic anhydrase family protein n=1 Tax=Gryllotalpicola protaetiae TaxID=2419771 RepID=A0A387BKR6_9MICO|nr:gamma carbonic anhydrase family protein [Gryllotalpicola protaetiae]AYG04463.1 gamma carbonic anhydrase family protein [Gryllotalpicola protaetiae]
MLYEHQGLTPRVHGDAVVAPSAVVSGDVELDEGVQVLHGAVITSEGGPVRIGAYTIVMENAVIRGVTGNAVSIGDHCLVGPHAYVSGATVEPEVFLATGSRVFNGAVIGRGSEVRIDAIVHLRTELPEGTTVPIGWVAVGSPPLIAPPEQHDEIEARQRELDFPEYVFGLDRDTPDLMVQLTERYGARLGRHSDDRAV